MFLRRALWLVVALPALAISVGRADGRPVFVLYREPKLVAALCGTWFLLAAIAWWRPEVLSGGQLARTMRRPAVALGLAAGAWLAATGAWGLVVENFAYELGQYLSFGLLMIVLVTWARLDARVPRIVEGALVASLAVVTLVGAWQWLGWTLPLSLAPIRPELGATHPSLMGYKNPAALAVAGQVFVLAAVALRTRSRWPRLGLGALLVVETLYVASLGSRTAILALASGLLLATALAVVALRAQRSQRGVAVPVVALVVFGLAVGLAAASDETLRDRLGSMMRFAVSPASYLDSDRGVYLRNTLHMARHEPAGVGLGDWQTAYPVYRLHGRSVSFDETFEVRRAHSDHVQMLGETGFVGLGLWLAWLTLLVVVPARDYLRAGDPSRLMVSAQAATMSVAMATDYFVELPYGKFQLFLVASLALAGDDAAAGRQELAGPRGRRGTAVALLLLLVALATGLLQASHLRKMQLSAEISRRYDLALAELSAGGRIERAKLLSVADLGLRFQRLPGGDKTSYRTHLALGHVAYLLGRPEAAVRSASRALELHPFSVDALDSMAGLAAEPCAGSWRRAREVVLNEARAGFEETYPSCGRPPDGTP